MWISWKIDANFTLKHHLGLISITFIHLFSDFKSFFISIFTPFDTVDVVYTWKYGGPHIVTNICANEMKLYVYNAYVL